VTAVINAEIFGDRRRRFLNAIGSGAVAIMPSAPVSVRSGDVEFIYRQDNDFYYLTGFAEPESVALFAPDEKEQFILFVRPRDKERETWTGRRAGLEGAVADYGGDRAFPIDDLDGVLENLSAAGASVDPRREDYDYGRGGWFTDPEGNRVELWQPPA